MYWIFDLEYELMSHCLKEKGKWWANHLFYNKEVKEIYVKLRRLDIGTVNYVINKDKSNG